MSATKLFWIDAVKAICMFSVYLLHSQQYYGLGNTDYGYALMPFYVNAFFFVSGYLFFKKYLAFDLTNIKSGGGECVKKCIISSGDSDHTLLDTYIFA